MYKIKVQKPGLCTTVQDMGRVGFQKFGIPVSGVMDEFSFVVANYLLGNNYNNAVLEVQYMGPTLEFDFDVSVAITGANLSAKLNGEDVAMWETINIKKGDVLSFGNIKEGVRTYIAFAGEIDVPLVNGSKSTLLKSKLGGFDGRQLKMLDEIEIKNPRVLENKNKLQEKFIPKFVAENEIRVILGPQDDYFTENGIKTFLSSEYTVTKDADRMGMRLSGEVIEHKDKADIISDAAVFGSIQVPGNGLPIILLADRQTTGGYTKIATVIKADLPKLAQMSPNNKIKFKKVELSEAQTIYKQFYDNLEFIKASFEEKKSSCIFKKIFKIFG